MRRYRERKLKSLFVLFDQMLERIWRPDTYFYNGKHSHIHTITVPNKLLRLSQDGDILYSMRLTIKASCPMELRNFPMDRQSCPLILGSCKSISPGAQLADFFEIFRLHADAYTSKSLVYEWQNNDSVTFVPGMALSQFDLISMLQNNYTYKRREGEFSVVQVSFNMQRHTGYFLIQVYVPCILIVVLSWVSFWIHREATSDRVGLGITTVLTLSTIRFGFHHIRLTFDSFDDVISRLFCSCFSLDSRTDLPKVRYATALDWFLLMSFFYCIATLLEFAGVHYFTKVGSGEVTIFTDDEWEDISETVEHAGNVHTSLNDSSPNRMKVSTTTTAAMGTTTRKRNSMICPIYNVNESNRYSNFIEFTENCLLNMS